MRRGFLAVSVLALLAGAPAAHAAFPQTPPNDPLFDASPLPNATNEQWDLASPAGGFDRGISADRAWSLTTGTGTVIGDLDVGVQFDHPDLAGRWYENAGETSSNGVDDDRNGFVDDRRGYDFYADDGDATSDTKNAHGTNVAGVLGAQADNGRGVAGIAPDSRLLPLRTSDNILHQPSRVGEALVYAARQGADVVSMSLGTDSISRSFRDAAAYAYRKNVVMVAPTGNEFHFHHEYPATLDEVIAVGGLNPDTANVGARDGNLAIAGLDFKVHASYADYGPHIDVVAPTQVPTTEWGGGYRMNWDGTSAAAPHVAGTAALVVSRGRAIGLKLTAGEVRQIIRRSADDLDERSHGYAPGWDQLSGWGRVNAYEAVKRVASGRIPPEVNITSPDWYKPVRGGVVVSGVVEGRSPARWTLEVGRGEQPGSWERVAEGRSTGRKPVRLGKVAAASLGHAGYTLRLQAVDSNGNVGEDRAYFRSLRDESLERAFPKALGTSGEASPTLANLAGSRAREIVLATSDGLLHVLDGKTGRDVPGWPKRMRSSGYQVVSKAIGPVRRGFLGTPAVGDVAGDAKPELVVTGLDGRVYVWDRRGRAHRGFPRSIGIRRPAEDGRLDAAIYSSPALADLDRDGKLDIVAGAADQRIYAWKGNGAFVPGWPVLARDVGNDKTKILSSPAIGDIDGDGSPDVVEGTAEAYGSTPATSGRVYAFSASGKLKPGWPVQPSALAADSIPIAGEGVPVSPALADVDGDGKDEVAVAAFTGQPELYRGNGERVGGPAVSPAHFNTVLRGARSRASAPAALALGANQAFGRTRPGGPLRFFGGLVDTRLAAAQLSPSAKLEFQHLLGGWDARSGDWLAGFPAPIEGWQVASGPAVADVDGDGDSEVIAGSSGYLLHAFREDGTEPRGWPKQTGGWLLASPAVGDVDGDGHNEVVAVTREGYLFAWDTPTKAGVAQEWPSFRHDALNTGRYR